MKKQTDLNIYNLENDITAAVEAELNISIVTVLQLTDMTVSFAALNPKGQT